MIETVIPKLVDKKFWLGKKVFLTGHTGFKGAWLALWLLHMGANVTGYALNPEGQDNLFAILGLDKQLENSYFGDIRSQETLKKALKDSKPDIVLHLAAQALVLEGYRDPIETLSTNIMGTGVLLETLRSIETVKTIVVVSSDKCYQNSEIHLPFQESDPLGGVDPYSASKACVEIVTNCYRQSFFQQNCILASARAGNVIGGGDWSKDRLLPDLLRSIFNNEKIIIRHPQAVRPWQHVLEPLSGYLILAQRLFKNGSNYAQPWNFGPLDKDAKTVMEILQFMQRHTNRPINYSIENNRIDLKHEANFLKLNCEKSNHQLGWLPKWRIDQAIIKTLDWHVTWESEHQKNQLRPLYKSNAVIQKTLEQINEYHLA
jgi:CDP-glucose 4,6-dehydratase